MEENIQIRIRPKLQRVTSPKHPGAIFFKVYGTKDDFLCKFYPGKEAEAEVFQEAYEGPVDTTSSDAGEWRITKYGLTNGTLQHHCMVRVAATEQELVDYLNTLEATIARLEQELEAATARAALADEIRQKGDAEWWEEGGGEEWAARYDAMTSPPEDPHA